MEVNISHYKTPFCWELFFYNGQLTNVLGAKNHLCFTAGLLPTELI